jgi:hypothetical protein
MSSRDAAAVSERAPKRQRSGVPEDGMTTDTYNDIATAALRCLSDIKVSFVRVYRLLRFLSERTGRGEHEVGVLRGLVGTLVASVESTTQIICTHESQDAVRLLYSHTEREVATILSPLFDSGHLLEQSGMYEQVWDESLFTYSYEMDLIEAGIARNTTQRFTVAAHTHEIWLDGVWRVDMLRASLQILFRFGIPIEVQKGLQQSMHACNRYVEAAGENEPFALNHFG